MRFWYGLITVLTITTCLSGASANAEDGEQRWFDVEVIVFKNKRANLSEELWPENSAIVFPDKIEDFVTQQLYPAPEGLVSADVSSNEGPGNNNNKTEDPKPGAFVLMPEEQYQLTGLYGSLTRSSWYEPLAHFAWRQPVKEKSEAEWVRVVAGKNYVEEFDYNGHEKDDSQLPKITSTTFVSETASDLLPKYQPVPEVDGSLQVYLSRYLHINTDLVIRIPGEEELDITAISNSLSSSMLELTNDGVMKEEYESSFDWSFQNDNWLDPQKQTTRVKRLLNYPLSQSRRIRSGEVHYFDHPLYGIIIQVRPYDSKANTSTNGTSAGR